PGMGGGKKGPEVTYVLSNPLLQKTTFGEADGAITPRLRKTAALFRRAGFPVALERNMEAWQKTHLAWVVPLALGIYLAGCDNYALAKRPDLVRLVIGAVRESFAALRRLGVPVTPGRFRVTEVLPLPLLAALMGRALDDRRIEIIAALHCRNAPGEIRHLTDGLLAAVRRAGTPHPSLERLLEGNPLYRQR
ncbi:MAG: hypothetical protein JXA20_10625, partial [Spirochaetes bacterium]|nr:hypothetical protein [Spirochaetota bacterium]